MAYVLFGVGGALMSGADDAYLFDSLRAVGRHHEFASVAGRLNGIMTVAIAGFTVVGGLMVVVTPLSWPIVASALLSLTAAVIAWRLKEPPSDWALQFLPRLGRERRAPRPAHPLAALGRHPGCVAAGRGLRRLHDLPADPRGARRARRRARLVRGRADPRRGERRLGLRPFARRLRLSGSLRLLPALGVLALFGGGSDILWLFPLFALAPFAQNALHPLIAEFISRRVPDSERATALSFEALAAQIGTIVVTLALSVLVDHTGLEAALAGTSVVLVMIAIVAYLLWWRAGDREIALPEDPAPA